MREIELRNEQLRQTGEELSKAERRKTTARLAQAYALRCKEETEAKARCKEETEAKAQALVAVKEEPSPSPSPGYRGTVTEHHET